MWAQDCFTFHTAPWWRRLWERTGLVEIETAGMVPDGSRIWLRSTEAWVAGGKYKRNDAELRVLRADRGVGLKPARTHKVFAGLLFSPPHRCSTEWPVRPDRHGFSSTNSLASVGVSGSDSPFTAARAKLTDGVYYWSG